MLTKPCLTVLLLITSILSAFAQQENSSKEKELLLRDNTLKLNWPALKSIVNFSADQPEKKSETQASTISFSQNVFSPIPRNGIVSSTACRDSSFKKGFEALNRAYSFVCSEKTNDGGILIGGYGIDKNSPPNTPWYAVISKFDSLGNHLWSREIQSYVESYVGINRIKELSDGSIIISGVHENKLNYVPPNYAEMFVAKLTAVGDLTWLKTYRTLIGNTCTSRNILYPNISEGANGDLVITATAFNCPFPKVLVTFKLNSSGVLQWKYAFTPPFNDAMGVTAFYEGSTVTVINKTSDEGFTAGGSIHTDLIKLDYATGALVSYKSWKIDMPYPSRFNYSFTNEVSAVKLANGNYCIYGITFGVYNSNPNDTMPHFTVLEFNNNHDFVNGYVIKTPVLSNPNIEKINVNKDKRVLYSLTKNLAYPNLDVYLGSLNNTRIEHQRRMEYRNQEVFYNNFESFGDGSYAFIHNLATVGQSSFKLEYSKLHNSDTGSICLGLPADFTSIEPVTYIPHNFTWASVDPNPFIETSNQNNLSLPIIYTASAPCIQIAVCDTLKIHGQGTACDFHQLLTFTVYKNPACGSPVSWSLPPAVVQQMLILNDTTVQVRLNQPWQGWLSAMINTSCGEFQDSIFIIAGTAPGPVNLGPDKQICVGNTVIFNAGVGYASYLWNNGSTDSSITVSIPGTYYVEVIDGCGQHYSDTVILSVAPPIPFSIGPDRIKCNSDTLHLNATTGFLNYSWGPNYNISSLTAQNVIVQPDIDTIYYVKAEQTPGCFAFDTVRITLSSSPSIYLGADTSICTGAIILLDAGPGFAQYQWSTGATVQQINVNIAGTFSIMATAANGCKSYDTLKVIKLFALPTVNLNKDSTLCLGDTRTLDAGSGFASYLWNTGSTQRTINVNGIGNFSVSVTDLNGCTGAGTTMINTILPLPSGFLPADTSMCSYSKIILKSTSVFDRYLWSDNSISPTLTVSTPGLYWLQATNNKNCTARDSILIVKKDCFRGLFIPSAFTPNGDAKNDLFKPSLYGTASRYEFKIYNRYGELIFSTGELLKGWDGTYKGKMQNAGVYVWKCIYQIDNQMLTTEQGTVLLIR